MKSRQKGEDPWKVATYEGVELLQYLQTAKMTLSERLQALEDIIRFKHDLNPELYQDVPIVKNTCYFLSRLKELQPLKATQKGNLPLAFTRELYGKFCDPNLLPARPVRSEEDTLTVHTLRHVLKLCGWVKKVRNQYSRREKGQTSS